MSNENISNEVIDFELLADIKQANIRDSLFELKRVKENKFNISNSGKLKIGYDESKGVNLKAGNGIVVIAVIPKDSPECTRGLLHAHLSNAFTSNMLEAVLKENNLSSRFYTFENPQEYKGATYYKLTPVIVNDEQKDASSDEIVSNELSENQPVAETTNDEESIENVSVTDQGEF